VAKNLNIQVKLQILPEYSGSKVDFKLKNAGFRFSWGKKPFYLSRKNKNKFYYYGSVRICEAE
jgi:hypothetical protein